MTAHRLKFLFTAAVVTFLLTSLTAAQAAGTTTKADIDKFYRPVTTKDLVTVLPPRTGEEAGANLNDTNFFSGNNGCPDSVDIGSVSGDSPIYGNVDINVVITSDIVIQCNGF